MNIREFNSGDCFDAYKWLGAHYNGFGTMFRVYAPNADGVSVIGDFNGWEDWYLNRTGDGKFWELFIDGAKPGHMYKYKVYHSFDSDHPDRGRFQHGTDTGTFGTVCSDDRDAYCAAGSYDRVCPSGGT